MNEFDVIKKLSEYFSNLFDDCNIDESSINWPNAVKDQTAKDLYLSVAFQFNSPIVLTLNKTKMVNGTVCVSIFDNKDRGLGDMLQLYSDLCTAFNSKSLIQFGINMFEPDLKILDNTLSQTQTTTDSPKSQINLVVLFTKVM